MGSGHVAGQTRHSARASVAQIGAGVEDRNCGGGVGEWPDEDVMAVIDQVGGYF